MRKFEYRFEAKLPHAQSADDLEMRLNQIGAEGWELVAVVPNLVANDTSYFFKREVKESARGASLTEEEIRTIQDLAKKLS